MIEKVFLVVGRVPSIVYIETVREGPGRREDSDELTGSSCEE